MNTCQTSVKIGILLLCLGSPHLESLPDKHDSTTVVPSELNKRGESQADKHWPPKYISYNETTETTMASYWSH